MEWERDLRFYTAGFEFGGKEKRNGRQQPLEAGKDKETDCPLEPPDAMQAQSHLDFCLLRLILNI